MADVKNLNVNGTTYNIVDDEAMRLASNPTNNNILVTNASGQAVNSGVNIDDTMLLVTNPTNNNVLVTNSNGQAVDSGVSISGIGSGMKTELLWTNSSPTSNFGSQTVTISTENQYALFGITYKPSTSAGTIVFGILPSAEMGLAWKTSSAGTQTSNNAYYRNVTVSQTATNISFAFDDAHYNGASNNANMIPLHIYGIR